jgi:hypothetical protein
MKLIAFPGNRVVYCPSLARIVVSNPAGGIISVSCECCVVMQMSLRGADHSSRGVLLTVVRRGLSRNLNIEEAIDRASPQRQRKKVIK